jgi:hypothetical protein
MNKNCMLFAVVLLLLVAVVDVPAQQQAEKKDLELAGYHDLQGRGAYQPVITEQGGRWIAYIGHHSGSLPNPLTGAREDNGTSIVDVTNPRAPRYLHHIPGERGSGAQMVRVCRGTDLPRADRGKVYMLRTLGDSAHEIWDVTRPEKPFHLVTVASGLHGTHKNWWECDTGIAYLVSGVPGWRTSRMTQIYDLSDPAKPVFIRNFGLPEQQPGASGEVPTGLHGAISTGPKGNRVYFGHGTNSDGILQIVDRDKLLNGPKQPTAKNLLYPQIARFDLSSGYGAHTVFPVLGMELPGSSGRKDGRDFVVVTNEALGNGCGGPRQKVWIIDVADETRPEVASTWEFDDRIGNFCARPGRVGAHSSHENFTPVYYRRIMFIAHFNAGVRAVDIRDPYHPKEIAYYVPAVGGRTVHTNNVEVDDRGYVYIVDRAGSGMHILELSGAARKVANFH